MYRVTTFSWWISLAFMISLFSLSSDDGEAWDRSWHFNATILGGEAEVSSAEYTVAVPPRFSRVKIL